MDKRMIANQNVKDSLLTALIELARSSKWSGISISALVKQAGVARSSFYRNFSSVEELIDYGITQMNQRYKQENPSPNESFRDKDLMYFKFRFFKEHSDLLLLFHHAQTPQTLLAAINDFVIDAYGDMPSNDISRYELYYYSGAFYNMVIHWLEDGAKESPEEMADEFLRIANVRVLV